MMTRSAGSGTRALVGRTVKLINALVSLYMRFFSLFTAIDLLTFLESSFSRRLIAGSALPWVCHKVQAASRGDAAGCGVDGAGGGG
jgi:hypothetical protein